MKILKRNAMVVALCVCMCVCCNILMFFLYNSDIKNPRLWFKCSLVIIIFQIEMKSRIKMLILSFNVDTLNNEQYKIKSY